MEKIKKRIEKILSKEKYHCANGANHNYICCPTCWNKHPDHIKGEDYRGQKKSKYPLKTKNGFVGIDEKKYL